MRIVAISAVLATLVCAADLGFAQDAVARYTGKWHLNVSKSNIGAAPDVAIVKEGDGRFTLTDVFKKSYSFAIDGRPYADPYGAQIVWSQPNPSTYRATATVEGKQTSIETMTLSADGQTFADDAAVIDTSGKALHQRSVYTRQGSGTGLAGTWKGGRIELDAIDLAIQPEASGVFLYKMGDLFESRAKFDGKAYPLTGSGILPGSTATFLTAGPRSFSLTTLIEKAPKASYTFEVSADGKTLTERGSAEGDIQRTWVFERQ